MNGFLRQLRRAIRPIPGTRSRDRDTGWRAGVVYNAAVASRRLLLNSQERRFALSERQNSRRRFGRVDGATLYSAGVPSIRIARATFRSGMAQQYDRPPSSSRRTLRCSNRDHEHNPAGHLPSIDLATNRALTQLICATFLDRGVEPTDSFASLELFVADHNRLFPTKYAKFGKSPLVSLDEVMFEDGSTTRGDNVSRGLWD
jgi:hypothetical protein